MKILVLNHGWLVVVCESGRPPTYYRVDWLGASVQDLLSKPESLTHGLPVDAVISQLVEQGFTVICRRGREAAGRR